MRLHDLKPNKGAKHRKKRVGNGESSGLGKTCGRGHKGQKSRSGGGVRPGFEGGQMPLARRLPKKGFNNAQFKTNYAVVNIDRLESVEGDVINEESLRKAGIIQGVWDGVKILGSGEISKKVTVEVNRVSASAKAKIEAAGGTVKELSAPEDSGKSGKAS
ncbi:MAG: 50S ribosomal protein L15 [Verrucomicrobiota bacterium]